MQAEMSIDFLYYIPALRQPELNIHLLNYLIFTNNLRFK